MSDVAANRAESPRVRVPAGTTAGAAVREAGIPTTGPAAAVVVRDAERALRDLDWRPAEDTEVVVRSEVRGRGEPDHVVRAWLARVQARPSWKKIYG